MRYQKYTTLENHFDATYPSTARLVVSARDLSEDMDTSAASDGDCKCVILPSMSGDRLILVLYSNCLKGCSTSPNKVL